MDFLESFLKHAKMTYVGGGEATPDDVMQDLIGKTPQKIVNITGRKIPTGSFNYYRLPGKAGARTLESLKGKK